MDNRFPNQLRDLIDKNAIIGIAVGKNPGVDEMASALSLYLVLQSENKNVSVVCPTEALVEHSRLVGIDKVKNNFDGGGGDMVVSFPYKEGEIDKISYTLENGFLNIIVKPGEEGLSFSERDVAFKGSEGYPTLLFVIGTPRLSDLERIFDPQALKDTQVINIDNKADNQGFGDIAIVSPDNSSISEKIADLIISLGLPIDIDTAQNLLIGIEKATDNFQNAKTSPLAFEMAGELIKKGAVRSFKRTDEISGEEASIFSPKTSQKQETRQDLRQEQRFDRRDQSVWPVQPTSTSRGEQAGGGQGKTLRQAQGKQGKNPPVDWLTPKIYKGSTNI